MCFIRESDVKKCFIAGSNVRRESGEFGVHSGVHTYVVLGQSPQGNSHSDRWITTIKGWGSHLSTRGKNYGSIKYGRWKLWVCVCLVACESNLVAVSYHTLAFLFIAGNIRQCLRLLRRRFIKHSQSCRTWKTALSIDNFEFTAPILTILGTVNSSSFLIRAFICMNVQCVCRVWSVEWLFINWTVHGLFINNIEIILMYHLKMIFRI